MKQGQEAGTASVLFVKWIKSWNTKMTYAVAATICIIWQCNTTFQQSPMT